MSQAYDDESSRGSGWANIFARHGRRTATTRRSRDRLSVLRLSSGAPGGTKWPMQPFWALGFPSLEALEECERVHNRVYFAPKKGRARKSTTPPGMQYPLSPRTEGYPETFTADPALGYSEMIAEHFARTIYFA